MSNDKKNTQKEEFMKKIIEGPQTEKERIENEKRIELMHEKFRKNYEKSKQFDYRDIINPNLNMKKYELTVKQKIAEEQTNNLINFSEAGKKRIFVMNLLSATIGAFIGVVIAELIIPIITSKLF